MGDKYAEGATVDIPCMELLPLCLGRCCTLKFFLTKQDLDEGTARWDYGNPYWIKQSADGYCFHSDPQTRACSIHSRRPHVCRGFDCRKNTRIWIDFEKRIPAPFEKAPGDAAVSMAEVRLQKSKAADKKHREEAEQKDRQEPGLKTRPTAETKTRMGNLKKIEPEAGQKSEEGNENESGQKEASGS
jgi:Fe-S-cluster containining protein